MKLFGKITLVLLSIIFISNANAQLNTYSISDLKWLSGSWEGEAFGGRVEEFWSSPSSNAMMGMFRLLLNNKDRLYEFLIIEESEKNIAMKFKHISSGYTELEDKPIILNLINLTDDHATFSSDDSSLVISYHIINEDELNIELLSSKENNKEIITIFMKRKK